MGISTLFLLALLCIFTAPGHARSPFRNRLTDVSFLGTPILSATAGYRLPPVAKQPDVVLAQQKPEAPYSFRQPVSFSGDRVGPLKSSNRLLIAGGISFGVGAALFFTGRADPHGWQDDTRTSFLMVISGFLLGIAGIVLAGIGALIRPPRSDSRPVA